MTTIMVNATSQIDLIQSIYKFLTLTEMFQCAPVSKDWNKATKLPTFHPIRNRLILQTNGRPSYPPSITRKLSRNPSIIHLNRLRELASVLWRLELTENFPIFPISPQCLPSLRSVFFDE